MVLVILCKNHLIKTMIFLKDNKKSSHFLVRGLDFTGFVGCSYSEEAFGVFKSRLISSARFVTPTLA